MRDHHFTVTVTTDTAAHAEQVMSERLGHDDDYGFAYEIDYTRANGVRAGDTVLIAGNPVDGFRLIGPIADPDALPGDLIDRHTDDAWWFTTLEAAPAELTDTETDPGQAPSSAGRPDLDDLADRLQAVLDHLRDAYQLALSAEGLPPRTITSILATVDDATTNHFDDLLAELTGNDIT